ncbi:MAG: hypothetical protein OEW11_11405 [Nitrospirota bacterium]|nr:hypothetical protein [Nitrospirota bacterium]
MNLTLEQAADLLAAAPRAFLPGTGGAVVVLSAEHAAAMCVAAQQAAAAIRAGLPVDQQLTVAQFSERFPAWPIGAVRKALFNRLTNGLADSGAISTRGKKILINTVLFMEWSKSQKPPRGNVAGRCR